MDTKKKTRDENGLQCPLGGDESNDCSDCAYSGDYHFVDGECVERPLDEGESDVRGDIDG